MNDSKTLLQDLFSYHHATNQEIIAHLNEYSEKISERSHDLISHTIVAHQLWNNRIDSKIDAHFSLGQIIPLNQCDKTDTQNHENTGNILENHDLDKNITYTNSRGEEFTNTIAEILTHIANHTSHHRGQLMTELKNCGIPTLKTDYIFHKRE